MARDGTPTGPMASRKLFKQLDNRGTEDLDEWRERFINTLDPTEYAGAIALLGSWKEWKKFKKAWVGFQNDILPEWIEEINVRIKSAVIESSFSKAREGETQAAKALLQQLQDVALPPPPKRTVKRTETVDDDAKRVLEYLS